jgi:hypothetical protein
MTDPFVEFKTLELGYAIPAGARSVTTNVTPISSLPPELLAVTLMPTEACDALGVPVIAPVVVLKLRPKVDKILAEAASKL